MDIPVQSKKVGFFIAEYGLAAVLKQMTCTIVTTVKILGIPSQELAHYGGDAVRAAFKKQMNVVVHEDPCIDGAFPLSDVFSQSFQEADSVMIINEYVCLIDPAHHDVVQCAEGIEAGLA